jgi:hypothetical protein
MSEDQDNLMIGEPLTEIGGMYAAAGSDGDPPPASDTGDTAGTSIPPGDPPPSSPPTSPPEYAPPAAPARPGDGDPPP